MMSALQVLADHVGDFPAQHRALHALGFDECEAHRLIAFVPAGLARPVLERLGVQVSPTASVALESGGLLEFSLDQQPVYVAAVALSRAYFERGCLPKETFDRIVWGTAEVDAVNNGLNEGASCEGSVISSVWNDPDLAKHIVRY